MLVHLGLVQVGNDTVTVLVAIVPDLGAAEVFATLLDAVGATEAGLGHAAEGTAACVYGNTSLTLVIVVQIGEGYPVSFFFPPCQIGTGDGEASKYLQLVPPGTQRPCWPSAAWQASSFSEVLATQHWPEGVGLLPFAPLARLQAT